MECRRIVIIGSSLLIALVLFTQVSVLLRKSHVRPYERDVNSKRKFRSSKIDWSTIVKPDFKI